MFDFRFLLIATAAVAGMAVPAAAHDLWLDVDGGSTPRIAVAYGHSGDRSIPDKARLHVLDLVAVSHPTSLLGELTARQDSSNPVLLSQPIPHKGGAVVVARLDNGFWVQTPYGTKNTSRLNAPDAPGSMWSQKFAKVLVAGEGADYTRAVGQRLEIVPLADPFTLKPGEALRVRVDFEGKPLAGREISVGDGSTKEKNPITATTDARGIASVALKPRGLSILVVSHRAPGSAPRLAADDALAATLSVTR